MLFIMSFLITIVSVAFAFLIVFIIKDSIESVRKKHKKEPKLNLDRWNNNKGEIK